MAERVITTKAVLTADDETGSTFAQVLLRLKKIEETANQASGRVEGIGRAVSAAAQVQGKNVDAMQRALDQKERAYDARREAAAIRVAEREEASVRRQEAAIRRLEHAEIKSAERIAEAKRKAGFGHYALGTAAAYVGAHSVVHGISDAARSGGEYAHAMVGLKNAGRTPQEIEAIKAAAKRTVAEVPTSTYTGNLETVLETTGAFGKLDHALENLTFMQKAVSVLQSASAPGTTVKAEDVAYNVAKFAEIRGSAGDVKRMQKEYSEMMAGMVFTGGRFNPHEAFLFAQQTSSLLQNYDPYFLSHYLPGLATEMGGERAGTRANAWANVIQGKARDKRQASEWISLGLIHEDKVIEGSSGPISWESGAVKDTDLALRNPVEWSEKVLIPALTKKGIDVNNPLAVTKELNTLFRNSEANRFAAATTQALQLVRLHNDAANIDRTGNADEVYRRNLTEDPTVGLKALTASIDNLMTVVSAPAMAAAAKGLAGLAGGIETVSNALTDHPALALAGGAAAAGGALAGAGALAYNLANGFGLTSSAAALDESAVALTAAAARLGAAGAVDGGAGLLGAAGARGLAARSFVGMLGEALPWAIAGGAAIAGGVYLLRSIGPETRSRGRGAIAVKHRYSTQELPPGHWAYGGGRGAVRRYVVDDHALNDDFTLGSMGGFQTAPGTVVPTRRFGRPGSLGAAGGDVPSARQAPQSLRVTFDPAVLKVDVTASSELLRVAREAKEVTLAPRADSPGGVGETRTDQQ
jgi:hypothetical protein